jgi:hypothetical protein
MNAAAMNDKGQALKSKSFIHRRRVHRCGVAFIVAAWLSSLPHGSVRPYAKMSTP